MIQPFFMFSIGSFFYKRAILFTVYKLKETFLFSIEFSDIDCTPGDKRSQVA